MSTDDAQRLVDRISNVRAKYRERDAANKDVVSVRNGDLGAVAGDLLSSDLPKPLVANLIETAARDIAEVMAPLPAVNVPSAALSNDSDQKRSDLRSAIANSYIQCSRLQDQMFAGADRYVSYGFMAYMVEPNFKEKHPMIRVDDSAFAYYIKNYHGRVCQYFKVFKASTHQLDSDYPDENLRAIFRTKFGSDEDRQVEVVRWYDDDHTCFVLLDPCIVLSEAKNVLDECPVRIIERPSVTSRVRGQFDDVIWVQVARALVAQYTMDAIEQSVHAPVVVPQDVDEIELGPFTAIKTATPGGVGRVNLGISNGLFPEQQTLAQEQRIGSRYPEARSGNVDASIVTGQGVQALMGTFDTQVQTFQRLNVSALEDVLAMCFDMDEKLWGGTKKTKRIKDNGAPRTFTYTPSKAINGEHVVDVSYGAIAGLDPNRALVFILQGLAGGILSKLTAMRNLPVDLNPMAEMRQIQREQVSDSLNASIAALPQAIPQMAMAGQDPRDVVLQIASYFDAISKGKDPAEAAKEVFAPKQEEQPEEEQPSPLDQAQGAGQGPSGLPGAGSGGASDLLMSLAGISPSGNANLQSNVSRMQPVQH